MSAKAAPKGRQATYADLEALPRHRLGEIIGDELVVSPRPGVLHAFTTTVLTDTLSGPFQRGIDGPGGWWILFEPELHFASQVLVPDVAAWRRERLPTLPDAPFMTMPPDWLCETLSPSTAVIDRTRKLDIYRREGVEVVWLVEPVARTLEVLRRRGEDWLVAGHYGGEAKIHAVPFEAVELDLEALWPALR